jgi:hypothetical protein
VVVEMKGYDSVRRRLDDVFVECKLWTALERLNGLNFYVGEAVRASKVCDFAGAMVNAYVMLGMMMQSVEDSNVGDDVKSRIFELINDLKSEMWNIIREYLKHMIE